MNKKKGFTLIELLAVLVILALLLVLAAPAVIRVLNRAEAEFTEAQKELIKKSAIMYVEDNKENISELKKDTVNYTITLEFLGSKGYLNLPLYDAKTKDEVDPKTVSVTVTKNSYGRFEYTLNGIK